MLKRYTILLLIALFALFAITSCGQSGPLYLPHSSKQKEATAHVDQ